MNANRFLLFILILSVSTACNSSKQLATNSESQDQEVAVNTRQNNPELEELFWARRDSTKLQFVQADVDFMAGMIGHHAQALIMSSLAEHNGASESVQTLAGRIINAQKDEIGIMQRWLSDRGQTVPQVTIEGLNLMLSPGTEPLLIFSREAVIDGISERMDHSNHNMGEKPDERPEEMQDKMRQDMENAMNRSSDMSHMANNGMNYENKEDVDHSMMMHDHSGMPGMLTQIQLEELADAKGIDFDRLFLRYMIQHHAGAITMVNELIETDGAVKDVQLNTLASDINVDQKTEIERMRLMLLQILESENGE